MATTRIADLPSATTVNDAVYLAIDSYTTEGTAKASPTQIAEAATTVDVTSQFTITPTVGTLTGFSARKYGKVVYINLIVRNSATTTAGSNMFTATLTGLLPALYTARGCGYVGRTCVVGEITRAGNIVCRATGADVGANVDVWIPIVYIID